MHSFQPAFFKTVRKIELAHTLRALMRQKYGTRGTSTSPLTPSR